MMRMIRDGEKFESENNPDFDLLRIKILRHVEFVAPVAPVALVRLVVPVAPVGFNCFPFCLAYILRIYKYTHVYLCTLSGGRVFWNASQALPGRLQP